LLRFLGLLILGVVLGVAATWGYHFLANRSGSADGGAAGRMAPRDAAEADGPVRKRLIFARGTLEPRGGVVLISSPLAGTRVQKIHVRDGQRVDRGELLVELDATAAEAELRLVESQRSQAAEQQKAEIQAAQQRVTLADLAVKQAEQSREVELDAQQKQINVAENKVKQAEDDLRRVQSSRRPADPAADAQLEQARNLLQLAESERDAARAGRRRLEQSLQFALEKAQAEQRAANQALEAARRSLAVESFDRQVAIAEQKVAQTQIVAPTAGTVISVLVHAGELVASQPLLQLADLSQLVCLAEVEVADIFQVPENQEAWIQSRALPAARIRGRVERIGNRAAPATLRPIDPREPVDRMVATVVISVDAAEVARQLRSTASGGAAALVGLQVDVEIRL
jgi:HlyD family secretion protein